jgi:hypothetical protein
MSPEERAKELVSSYGYDVEEKPRLTGMIADAIREAVGEEQERCAKIVDVYGMGWDPGSGLPKFCAEVAAAVRGQL